MKTRKKYKNDKQNFLNMKHYDSIPSIKEDKSLVGENIFAFNKLDGQNF